MMEKNRTASLDWDDLRFFVELARRGSLTATARALRVNHATVSRRLARLEEALGRSLFDRRHARYTLTEDGRSVLAKAAAMDEAAMAVLGGATGGTARGAAAETPLAGKVRVTATRGFADGFLVPRLAELAGRHPALDIELVAGSRNLSLSRRETDIALRFGRPEGGELVARRLATVAFGFYASPACAGRLAAGADPVFVGFDDESNDVPEARWLADAARGRRVAFRSNSPLCQAEMARRGWGIALLPRYLAAGEPALVPVPVGPPLGRDVWLLIRPEMAKIPRVRAVADHLTAIFDRDRALLAGEETGPAA